MLVLSLIKPLGDEKPFAEEKWLRRYSALTSTQAAEEDIGRDIFGPEVSCSFGICGMFQVKCLVCLTYATHVPMQSTREGSVSSSCYCFRWNMKFSWTFDVDCRIESWTNNLEQLWYDSVGGVRCSDIMIQSNNESLSVIALKWSWGLDTMER